MKTEEARRLVALLIDAFPQTPVRERTPEIWEKNLRDLDYSRTLEVVETAIADEGDLPRIGEIRRAVIETEVNLPTALDAWASIVTRGAQFHPLTAEVVTLMGGTFSIRNHDEPTIVRAQFLKAYEERREERLRRANIDSFRRRRSAA